MKSSNTILVTGGSGFIGSNFIDNWLASEKTDVVNLDKLTYAGNPENLRALDGNRRYKFILGDIGNAPFVSNLLRDYRPAAIVNFAAETHVDRSIHGPEEFVQTNVVGTFRLLEATRHYWLELEKGEMARFRFLHVSTDEVYGSLGLRDSAFREVTPYSPNSPYSASKAAADHLVRAYYQTYGLPTLTTNCSNNYGPFQFPEKLIPLITLNALAGRSLPIYGDGMQIRDWLYVSDHCNAIRAVLANGRAGETYNIGGGNEITNIEIVRTICRTLQQLCRPSDGTDYESLIRHVRDRPGHDRRYAIDASKIKTELGWKPVETFESGIRKTLHWYLANRAWWESVMSGEYRNWVQKQYGYRPGIQRLEMDSSGDRQKIVSDE